METYIPLRLSLHGGPESPFLILRAFESMTEQGGPSPIKRPLFQLSDKVLFFWGGGSSKEFSF